MTQFKKKIATYTAMLAFLSLSSASVYAVTSADVAGKTGNMSVIDTSSTRTDVNINAGAGAVGQVDWSRFSVGKDEHVNFGFSNVSQTVINRVLGGQASSILGKMTNSCIADGSCATYSSTGKVILINPAGVMFGAGSQVDLNSFTVSTFDFRGAKNLKNMTDSALNEYQTGTLNKLSPNSGVNGEGRSYGNIYFDSNYTKAYEDAGITIDKGNTQITLDGTTFDHFYNKEAVGNNNLNKSIALVSDNINYKDSLLRTAMSFNYGRDTQNPKSFSNVKLVTADGVTFSYLANGYIDDQKVAADTKTDVTRNISIDNTNLASNTPAIESGNVYINNNTNKSGSDIKIKNSVIRGDKLVNYENGDVVILSSHDINLDHSRIETKNTDVSKDGVLLADTQSQDGGEILLSAGDNVKSKDSLIITSGAKNQPAGSNAGNIYIYSFDKNVDLDNTRVISMGDVNIDAMDSVKMNNSIAYAANDKNTSEMNTVKITGTNNVDLHNSAVNARGNVDIKTISYDANNNQNVSGNVKISSDLDSDGKNQTVIKAGDKLSIQAKNTTLDNASLVYKEVKFYNDGAKGTNNLTVKNNSTFTPLKSDGSFADDINIETNGNITFDNATVKRSGYSIKIDPKENDNGTPDARQFTAKSKTTANAVNLNVNSTDGNITVQNNSNIAASNNINMTSAKGNYTQNDSKLTAANDANVTALKITLANSTINATTNNATLTATGEGDNGNIEVNNSTVEAGNDVNVKTAKGNKINVKKSKLIAGSDKTGFDKTKDANDTIGNANIEATKGSVYITDDSTVKSEDSNVNITAYNTIKFGNKGAEGINIDKSSNIQADKNVKIKSTNGNIEGEKTTMPEIKYGERLTFDAAKNNIFTSEDSLKSVNVDYKAGESNRFYTQGDIQFVNSSLESPNNFVESGKDVILNNLTIKSATSDPKDTTTQIFANGNVTTNNVTGEDLNASGPYTYPKSVSTTRTGTGKTTLDVNKTKLKITTETVKDLNNPDNGSITLDIKNADNTKAGVELTAQNVNKLDKDPEGGYFKPGYYKSGVQQWDENIDPKQGPEIHLNATDNKIAIADLTSDKLTLDPNDIKLADTTKGTPSITVRDQGGLNLDPYMDYDDGTPTGFTYDKDYVDESTIKTIGGDLKMNDDWSEWKPTGKEWYDPDGTKHTEYYHTRTGEITDRITTQTDTRHEITFDNNGQPQGFNLIYDKQKTTKEPGKTLTYDEVKNNPSLIPPGSDKTPDDFIEKKDETKPCPPEPEVKRSTNSLIDIVKIPKEQKEISKTSKVSDNTVDQSSNIMSAAAKVDLSAEMDSTYDDEEDFE